MDDLKIRTRKIARCALFVLGKGRAIRYNSQ